MKKWPSKTDDNWPDDLPKGYFHPPGQGGEADGISWKGLRAVIIGLCRRVESLERDVDGLEKQVHDLMQWP